MRKSRVDLVKIKMSDYWLNGLVLKQLSSSWTLIKHTQSWSWKLNDCWCSYMIQIILTDGRCTGYRQIVAKHFICAFTAEHKNVSSEIWSDEWFFSFECSKTSNLVSKNFYQFPMSRWKRERRIPFSSYEFFDVINVYIAYFVHRIRKNHCFAKLIQFH